MRRFLIILAFSSFMASCATQPTLASRNTPGFLLGLANGFFMVLAFIGSFFWDIRIYAFPNSGRWYDAGFVLGAAIFFGMIGRESEKYYAAGYKQGFLEATERHENSD